MRGHVGATAAELPDRAVGLPDVMSGSHWKAALGLELMSHSWDVQRVLKGKVSVLQMDPQKSVPPSSPRPALSAKRTEEENSAANEAGKRPRSQPRRGRLCFKLAHAVPSHC